MKLLLARQHNKWWVAGTSLLDTVRHFCFFKNTYIYFLFLNVFTFQNASLN